VEFFGIDIGDGESAVAYALGLHQYPDMIEIDGSQNIMTVLSIAQDGTRRIGKAAIQAARNQQEMHVRFKSGYLNDSSTGRWIEQFARILRERIIATGRMQDSNEAYIYIGCPSGWDKKARESYQALMEAAGFCNVSIISESRAALIYAREAGELRLTMDQLQQPLLIIDAGSSTVDFTFVSDSRIQDWGEVNLGGGIIDALLLDYNIARMDNRHQLLALFEKEPRHRAMCELFARGVKESYFNALSIDEPLLYPIESSFRIYTNPPIMLTVECDNEIMEEILSKPVPSLRGQSFISTYKDALEKQRTQMEKTPQVILMTGGASHMPFMRDHVRKAFPNAMVTMGIAPEFAIARGLCMALRMEVRRKEFIRDVEAFIQSDAVETIVFNNLDSLFTELSPLLVDEICGELVPDIFCRWRDGRIETLQEMREMIETASKELLENQSTLEKITPIVAKWTQTLRPQLEEYTSPICDANGIDRASLRLPSLINLETGLPFEASKIVNFDAVKVMIDIVAFAVMGTIAGGGELAFIASGPVGWVIGAVVGLIAAFIGTHYAEKAVMNANLPLLTRRVFKLNSVMKKLNDHRQAMIESFMTGFNNQIDERADSIMNMTEVIAKAIQNQLCDEMEQAVFIMS